MTQSRRLEPGTNHMTSRRTQNRAALLRPSEFVNQVFLYALGAAQTKAPEVEIYATVTEVTHHHTHVRDGVDESRLSDFFRELHCLTARALNAHYGRGENFWSQPASWANTEIHRLEDLTDKLLYLWTNPVKDGLTATPDEWPGVIFLPEDLGTTRTIRKPEGAFFGSRRPNDWEPTWQRAKREQRQRRRKRRQRDQRRRKARAARSRQRKLSQHLEEERLARERAEQPAEQASRSPSALPDEVTLRIGVPPGFEDWPIEEVRRYFRVLLDARVAEIHAEREAEGWEGFVGAEAVKRLDPRRSVGDTWPAFRLNPRLACKGNPALLKLLKADLLSWRGEYRKELEAWCAGESGVVFPAGSYWLPRFHGAPAAKRPHLFVSGLRV